MPVCANNIALIRGNTGMVLWIEICAYNCKCLVFVDIKLLGSGFGIILLLYKNNCLKRSFTGVL